MWESRSYYKKTKSFGDNSVTSAITQPFPVNSAWNTEVKPIQQEDPRSRSGKVLLSICIESPRKAQKFTVSNTYFLFTSADSSELSVGKYMFLPGSPSMEINLFLNGYDVLFHIWSRISLHSNQEKWRRQINIMWSV